MTIEQLIPIFIGALMAGFTSLMLFFARKISRNEMLEIQVKRVNLLDPDDVRLQASFLNTQRSAEVIKDFTIVYKDGKNISTCVDLMADPFIVHGGKKDKMDVDMAGHSRLRIESGSACNCYYSFQRKEGFKRSETGKFYVRYIGDRNRYRYATFEIDDPHSQLLHFVTKPWEK